MVMRVAQRASAFIERVFPERQIYDRTEGHVRYFTLSTRTQVLMATCSALAIGTFVFLGVSAIKSGPQFSWQSQQWAREKAQYERWLAEARAREASAIALLQTRTTEFEGVAEEFQRRHETMKDLLEQMTREDDAPGRSVSVRQDGGDSLVMMAAVQDPTPRVSRATPAQAAATQDYAGMDTIAAMMAEQSDMLDQAEQSAQTRVENLRAVLSLTGVDPDVILAEGARDQGGPFVPLDQTAARSNDPFAAQFMDVATRVGEAERLERAIDSAPVGAPVDAAYRLTSGFGPRVDPITSRPGNHQGLDFGAHRLAPIVAPAPGRVSFVGWKGGYGNVVEVDHGHGFKTRYGHLQRAYVRRGDEVAVGERLGAMGSTGRSTGVHLHYEVWFKGKPYDPALFLKAGSYVQQG